MIGTWVLYSNSFGLKGLPEEKYIFKENGEVEYIYYSYRTGASGNVEKVEEYVYKGEYEIVGNNIYIFIKESMTILRWYKSNLYNDFKGKYIKE